MRERIRDAGAIPALVALLESGLASGEGHANTLVSLIMSKDNRPHIAKVSKTTLLPTLFKRRATHAVAQGAVCPPTCSPISFKNHVIHRIAHIVAHRLVLHRHAYSTRGVSRSPVRDADWVSGRRLRG